MHWDSYEDYLNSPEWQKLREIALNKAKHRCQVCNSDNVLQVHHRIYDAKWGEESTDDLVVLCSSCHMLFHRNESRIRKVNKLEKKLKNIKINEQKRKAKIRAKADPYFGMVVAKSSPVRTLSRDEIDKYYGNSSKRKEARCSNQ